MSSDANPPAVTNHPPSGLWRRVAAMFYDSFLVFALCLAVTALTLPMRVWLSSSEAFRGSEYSTTGQVLVFMLLLVTVCGFFTWFWKRTGQTLGMQTWRIQVESLSGDRLSTKQCLIRLAGALISAVCLGAGYWWLFIDKQKRTWHDRWSDSRVVQLPRKKSG